MADQVLRNPRHERFAQELATGKSADAGYVSAGYRTNRSNAARLSANQDIQRRVAEIQSMGAEHAAITVETLIAEAEAARKVSPAPFRCARHSPGRCRLSDRNIHSCLAMPDQVLRNPRDERFAQELATGKTADAAYVLAQPRSSPPRNIHRHCACHVA